MKAAFLILFPFLWVPISFGFEVVGNVGLGLTSFNTHPPELISSKNQLSYGLLGHFEFEQTNWELGVLHTGAQMIYSSPIGEQRADSGYWLLPILYRMPISAPFFSIAFGPDYAIATHPSGGFKNHGGVQLSVEGVQEIGDNYGIVGNFRFRQSLGSPFTLNGENSSLRFFLLTLGIQKRLE